MGQALAQMPQAMHLLTLSAPGARTITCMGQASTHDAVVDLGLAVGLGGDADTAQLGVKRLVERLGAGPHTAQARHAGILFADH